MGMAEAASALSDLRVSNPFDRLVAACVALRETSSVGELVTVFRLSRGGVKQSLTRLAAAGFLDRLGDGRGTRYRYVPPAVTQPVIGRDTAENHHVSAVTQPVQPVIGRDTAENHHVSAVTQPVIGRDTAENPDEIPPHVSAVSHTTNGRDTAAYGCDTAAPPPSRRKIQNTTTTAPKNEVGYSKAAQIGPRKEKPRRWDRGRPVVVKREPVKASAAEHAAVDAFRRVWRDELGQDMPPVRSDRMVAEIGGLLQAYTVDEQRDALRAGWKNDFHRQRMSPGYAARNLERMLLDKPAEGGSVEDEMVTWGIKS